MTHNQSSAEFFMPQEENILPAVAVSSRLMTKSLVQNHRQCTKRAWFEFHTNDVSELNSGDRANLVQGQNVHKSARTLYPDAVNVRHDLLQIDAANQTSLVLAAKEPVILGASFVSNSMGISTRIDVLEQGHEGYKITNVTSGTSVKEQYLDDAAIDLACLNNIAIDVQEINIMHPNSKISLPEGGTGAEVLTIENVTNEVKTRAIFAVKWIEKCANTLSSDMPVCETGDHCNAPTACPYASKCCQTVENKDNDLIEYLPSKSGPITPFIISGTKRISDIPFAAMTNKRNAMVRTAIINKCAVVSIDLANYVRSLPYPRNVLDFETASFAIPRFTGMHSYQPLPFQWSMHSKSVPGAELVHHEFIDVTGNDPRIGFIENLLKVVGEFGPVFVYSHFEKTRLNELALEFPVYREKLLALVDRLVDLLPLARQGYYAPEMRGSWSLKAIQPTLPACADLQAYSEIGEVADGLAAQAAYMDQIDCSFIGEQKETQLKNMKIYCKADTRTLAHFVDVIEASNAVEIVCPVPAPKVSRARTKTADTSCAAIA